MFRNNVPDPLLSGPELPPFKFEMDKSQGRVDGGSFGKEATVTQLPIVLILITGLALRRITRC